MVETTVFENFSEKAIKSIVLAQQEARRYCHNSVGTEHILLGLIGEGTGTAAYVLKQKVGITDVRGKVEALIGRGLAAPAIELPFTPRARAVLQIANAERERLGHESLDTGHILWAMMPSDHLDVNAGSVAARALEELGINCADIREQVMRLLENPEMMNEIGAANPGISSPAGEVLHITDIHTDDLFQCPHCRERIRIGAMLCRFCQRNPSDQYRRCEDCAEWIQEKAVTCRFCNKR
jgi:ATP-dependent Clp protease ATP-binding subunit ClpC